MSKLRFALVALLASSWIGIGVAAPIHGPIKLSSIATPVRWVCEFDRCWWQPDYYKYGAEYYINNYNYFGPRCNDRFCYRRHRW